MRDFRRLGETYNVFLVAYTASAGYFGDSLACCLSVTLMGSAVYRWSWDMH